MQIRVKHIANSSEASPAVFAGKAGAKVQGLLAFRKPREIILQ
jgi:hypothetical protein